LLFYRISGQGFVNVIKLILLFKELVKLLELEQLKIEIDGFENTLKEMGASL
jgi:hypothetical protein